jgi:pyruvate dehydrogenase E1 component alpha subunit
MPRTTIAEFRIDRLQILNEQGVLDETLAKNTLSDDDVKSLYEMMIVCREFDEAAFKLQRSGRMGTFPQNKGQEATTLGAARAMRRGVDYLVPFYRENPAAFYLGLPMHYINLFWMGDERGNAIPRQYNINPLSIAIGTQTLHAVGIAWAFKLRKEPRVVTCFFGDGATSTGDFHEAMNFASTFKLPVVFSCINNGWAISTPSSAQTASHTFAQKAIAYGMNTIQTDGNDLFASYVAHKEAIERARDGGGPSFIESCTYRLADHTTADDARRYRKADELESHRQIEPLIRTRKYLERKGVWNDELQRKQEERAKVIVQEVTQYSLNYEPPKLDDVFDFVFEEMPDEIAKQKEHRATHSIGQDPLQIGLQEHQHH